MSRHIKGRARGNCFSLLAENDKDVKTVQSLMRHANSNITMNIYTHAVSSKKRQAQGKVVEMIRAFFSIMPADTSYSTAIRSISFVRVQSAAERQPS